MVKTDMIKKVKAWIEKYNLIPSGSIVLAACSGGTDSMALVHILSELCKVYNFTLTVGHVDHMFRGKESADDAKFVADFCRELNVACYQTAVDVPRFIEESRLSAEEAARVIRYDYLRKVAKELGGALIATGHHRDDQAETVLMHLLRGSGGDGLSGMKARNRDVIRPLLAVSRSEIEEYSQQRNFSPRLDSSNLQTDYLRNDIRLTLLPLLRRRYNRSLTDAFCRTAEIIGDEHAFVRQSAESVWSEVVISEGQDEWILDASIISCLHIAVQRELFRQIIEKKIGTLKGITFAHVEKLINLTLSGETGSVIELPGRCIIRKEYDRLFMGTKSSRKADKIEPPGIRVNVPGVTQLPNGCFIEAALHSVKPQKKSAQTAIFDWGTLAQPIIVRNRAEGDRFSPLGMKGSKKVKEYFIDAKIPRKERDEALIFLDASQIIWLGGYRQAEHGKVTEVTREFLQLTICQNKIQQYFI